MPVPGPTQVEGQSYLRCVVSEHAHLDRAGAMRIPPGKRIVLDDVFVSLRGVESQPVDDRISTALDRSLQELEHRLRSGRISPLELEVEVEQLYERMLHGDPAAAAGPGPTRALGRVVAENGRLLLLGEPGIGKTTLLRWLAQRHASERLDNGTEIVELDQGAADQWSMPVRFPIYARAASLTTLDGWRDRTLGELVIEDHQRRGYPGAAELAELFSRELIHGSCLAMIDGIDEITSLEDRRAMVDLVGRFDDRWGSTGNRFVVTSRSAGDWRELIRHFATYQACDVGREQRAALLARYCLVVEGIERPLSVVEHLGATAKQRAVDVVSALRQSRGLARLATNPLLLTVLILGQRSDRGMPTQRAAAYDAVARLLETGWSVGSRVEVDDLPDHRLLRRFLVQLAGWIQEHRPSGVVDLDDLLAAVGELWTTRPQAELAPGGGWTDELRAEVERVVAGICRHHGLLIERGPQQWSFLHRGLQEYYVARSLIDQPAPAYAIRCRLHDRDYAEPVLLALGIATHVTGRPDAAEVFDAALLATGPHADTRPDLFVPADLEELIGRDRKFAVLAAADEVDIDPRTLEWLAAGQIPKDLLPGLAGTALGRRHSAHRLAQAVASGAGHDVRWACGASLAQLGEKATAAELFRSLAVDPAIDGELRRRSAVSLGQLGDTSPETFELLRSLVADQGSEADLRWRSAVSLGRLGDTSLETEELLLTLASKHGIEEDVRWSCAAALGQLGQAATSAALLRDLASDAGVDGYVRWSAVASLGWLGDTSPDTLDVLRRLAADPRTDSDVRWSSAASLGRLGDKAAATTNLLRRLAADPETDSDVRWSSAASLGRLGERAAAAELLRSLASDPSIDGDVRWSSAEELRRLGHRAAAASLFRMLAGDVATGAFVRWSSAESLGRLGDAATAAAWFRMLASDPAMEPDVRRRSAASLGQLGDTGPETLELLSALAEGAEGGSYLRWSSATSLGLLGEPDAAAGHLRALVALPDAGGYIGRRSVEALGQLGDTGAGTLQLLEALVTASGVDCELRREAAEALDRLGILTPPYRPADSAR